MRILVVLLILAVLGWLFIARKQQEPDNRAATQNIPAESGSPRPVSQHNWPKHALDKANTVKRQIAEQRKSDGTR
jgi:hypothetical protein